MFLCWQGLSMLNTSLVVYVSVLTRPVYVEYITSCLCFCVDKACLCWIHHQLSMFLCWQGLSMLNVWSIVWVSVLRWVHKAWQTEWLFLALVNNIFCCMLLHIKEDCERMCVPHNIFSFRWFINNNSIIFFSEEQIFSTIVFIRNKYCNFLFVGRDTMLIFILIRTNVMVEFFFITGNIY